QLLLLRSHIPSLHLLYPDSLFWTCLYAAGIFAFTDTEIAFDRFTAGAVVRLQYAIRAVHHTHKAGTAFLFIILDMAGFRIFGKGPAHTGHHTFRLVAVAAEYGSVASIRIFVNKIPGLIGDIRKVQG